MHTRRDCTVIVISVLACIILAILTQEFGLVYWCYQALFLCVANHCLNGLEYCMQLDKVVAAREAWTEDATEENMREWELQAERLHAMDK